jgi:hypothetical protein
VLAEGATFAAYEVRRRLAVGGMGEVYLCRHRLLDRLDAVKVLRPHLASDEVFRARFLREALSAARLRHPNVVLVYTVDEADGLLYLAMEYVVGEDLASLLQGTRILDPQRMVRLLRPVADALDTAHRAQLVHRDIKPSNLIVTDVGTAVESVTLVDFGIARPLDGGTEITRTGEIVGTIAYCSPEQLSRRRVDGACDQYALACVAYECLTGEVPFPREGQLAIMTAHLTAPPPSACAVQPGLPEAVDTVLARAMAKEPATRFPTCTHFVAALDAALLAPRDHPDFPSPSTMATRIRSGQDTARRAGHPDTLALRVGWGARGPVVAPIAAGAVAVRGEAAAAAGVLRWLLVQAVALHAARDVCLVVALAPAGDESWLWVNWLPHARPTAMPIAGPHVATTPEAAEDLMHRLGQLVAARTGSGGPSQPRVLALLDGRLGVQPDDSRLARANWVGVHCVFVLPPGQPTQMSTLEVFADSGRLTRSGYPPLDASLDEVSTAYARELVDHLPED